MPDDFSVVPRPGMRRFLARRTVVFAMAYIGYAACYLVRNNVALVSEIMTRELGWTAVQIGGILTGFTISYGIGKLVMGVAVDNMRLRHAFAWALATSALLCIAMTWQRDPVVLTILLVLIGLVQGACAPAALAMLGAWYPPLQRGSRVAAWNTSQNVGAGLLAVLVSGGLGLVGPDSWTVAFWLPGIVALVCAGLVARYGGDRPWQERMPTLRAIYGSAGLPHLSVPPEISYGRLVRVHVLGNGTLLLLGVLNALLYLVRFGILNWIPISGAEQRGQTVADASMLVTVFEWGAIPGALAFAWIGLRRPRQVTTAATVGIAVLVPLLLVYALADDIRWAAALALPLGALVYGPQVIVNILTLTFVSPRAVGVAIGWVGLGGYLVGAVLANLSLPRVAAQSGWAVSIASLAGVCALCVLICLRLRRAERAVLV